MSFGPIMRLSVNDLVVELAPLNRDVMEEFIHPGMQSYIITKYLTQAAKTAEDEYEWYDKVRQDETSMTWGIWIVEGDSRILIGTTALHDLKKDRMMQAVSGSMLFRKEYWGKGIASHIHMARTWYGFQQMGLHRITSKVIQGNIASRRALEKSGYNLMYVERNTNFVDGKLRHMDNLECLNPNDPFWSQWWNGDRPSKQMLAARERSTIAMEWAKQNVELP
jgi:RimJ/RimL family protein N-acetyltransferase